jgi:hypothetical protein
MLNFLFLYEPSSYVNNTHRDRQTGDLISLLSFLESRLKVRKLMCAPWGGDPTRADSLIHKNFISTLQQKHSFHLSVPKFTRSVTMPHFSD